MLLRPFAICIAPSFAISYLDTAQMKKVTIDRQRVDDNLAKLINRVMISAVVVPIILQLPTGRCTEWL
jgi:hypothetical protein